MKIEVLYLPGCPNHGVAVARVREVVGPETDVIELEVTSVEMAEARGFPGSPSVRVDGVDVEPGAYAAGGFGIGCRTYVEDGVRSGAPSVEMIRRAVLDQETAAVDAAATRYARMTT